MAFQLPLIVYGIGMAGLLSADTLLKYWRHGATAIFVISMIVTPSQDPISMLMMAIPLTILFVASVYAVKFMERKKARAEVLGRGADVRPRRGRADRRVRGDAGRPRDVGITVALSIEL